METNSREEEEEEEDYVQVYPKLLDNRPRLTIKMSGPGKGNFETHNLKTITKLSEAITRMNI
jgi:hypothetical protein